MPLVPSPKLHDHPLIVPSGSNELDPLNATAVNVWVAWSGPAFACGGWFGAVAGHYLKAFKDGHQSFPYFAGT